MVGSYLPRSQILGIKIHTSDDYWLPRGFSFYSEQGPLEVKLPEFAGDVRDTLTQEEFKDFFGDSQKILIGRNLKDVFSIFQHYGFSPRIRAIDLELLRKLDVLNAERYPRGETAQDFYFQFPWIKDRLEKDRSLANVYRYLIEGAFNTLAAMENTGIRMRDGNHVYPNYRLGAVSGRFSCSQKDGFFSPHSISKLVEERYQYLPPEGHKMILVDQAAMEMRTLAHLSGDRNLTEVFNLDLDIHEIVARKLLERKLHEGISEEEREIAKAVGYLMVFGGTAYGLAKKAQVSQGRAQSFIDGFFGAFPSVEAWVLKTRIECLERGCITSIFGRIRKLNRQSNTDSELRSMQNFCVQSAAADINTLSLRSLHYLLPAEVKILLHLHDGGVFSALPQDVEETCDIIKQCMEHPPGLKIFGVDLKVPLSVKIRVTDHWE